MQKIFTTAALSLLSSAVEITDNINWVDRKTLAPNALNMTKMNAVDRTTLAPNALAGNPVMPGTVTNEKVSEVRPGQYVDWRQLLEKAKTDGVAAEKSKDTEVMPGTVTKLSNPNTPADIKKQLLKAANLKKREDRRKLWREKMQKRRALK